MESYNEIKTFLNGTIAKEAPIIPVSAHHDVNLDILIQAIEETIPTPNRDSDERAVMHIARSFDVNRPGTRPSKLMGGVIGGSIVEGTFREGDKVIIGPGRKIENGNKSHWEPIETTITSMQGGGGKRDEMTAGGLCAFGTLLDPSITTADNLSGQVLAKEGELPEIRTECSIEINLMKNMVAGDDGQPNTIHPLRNNEMLMVNVATSTSVGIVKGVEKGKATLHLRLPICADRGQRVSLSRRVGARWRLIGHGTIQ